jgi:hypothetical protein
MGQLSKYRFLPIDWDMTPEEAVTMYLEWGNNWRKGQRTPVRSKHDESYYFVLNTWDEQAPDQPVAPQFRTRRRSG